MHNFRQICTYDQKNVCGEKDLGPKRARREIQDPKSVHGEIIP